MHIWSVKIYKKECISFLFRWIGTIFKMPLLNNHRLFLSTVMDKEKLRFWIIRQIVF